MSLISRIYTGGKLVKLDVLFLHNIIIVLYGFTGELD